MSYPIQNSIQAIQNMDSSKHRYLTVVRTGQNEHLEVTYQGFFGRFLMMLGFSAASMTKVAQYISANKQQILASFPREDEEDIRRQAAFREKFAPLRIKMIHYTQRHFFSAIVKPALRFLDSIIGENSNPREEASPRSLYSAAAERIRHVLNPINVVGLQAAERSLNEEQLYFLSYPRKAERLSTVIFDLLNKVPKDFSLGSRSGTILFFNMATALQLYSKTSSLSETFDPKWGDGMSSGFQPNTVEGTFKKALDVSGIDGIKGIVASIKENRSIQSDKNYNNQAEREALRSSFAKVGAKVIAFLEGLPEFQGLRFVSAQQEVGELLSKERFEQLSSQEKAGALSRALSLLDSAKPDCYYEDCYRNSPHVFYNMKIALQLYSEFGDLEQEFEPSESLTGQGATLQPRTVLGTFRQALEPEVHGGIQETIKAEKENALDDQHPNCAFAKAHIIVGEKVLDFLRELLSA